ncbi:10453_t:CDS:2 [Acaulospora colombiana]|uniref:10453_t:CDS:1 n=1 Tax=Acaulospora colombiana TaxID=27376 RepID=A0ACA9KFU2_9GLOM|nr:10453_t:CDS:2 [Acaulospora colombiana]
MLCSITFFKKDATKSEKVSEKKLQAEKSESVERFRNAPPLRTELSSGFSSATPNIWVKYGDSRSSKVVFDGRDVDDLIEVIKKRLSRDLDNVVLNRITLRRHGEEEYLRPGLPVDKGFENDLCKLL